MSIAMLLHVSPREVDAFTLGEISALGRVLKRAERGRR